MLALALLVAAFGALYRDVLAKLVADWAADENYSHGFLIVPIALYFAWKRRHRLAALPSRPASVAGLLLVAGSVAVLAAGVLGAELFLTRLSMLGVLAGAVLFLYGWNHLRVLAFPLAFLLLMIPIPAIIFNQIAFPLQLLASRFGELALDGAGVPVLREGNVITLANTTLEVAEACSGIRSLDLAADARHRVRLLRRPPHLGARHARPGVVPVAIVANGDAGGRHRHRRALDGARRGAGLLPHVLRLARLPRRLRRCCSPSSASSPWPLGAPASRGRRRHDPRVRPIRPGRSSSVVVVLLIAAAAIGRASRIGAGAAARVASPRSRWTSASGGASRPTGSTSRS